MSLAIAATLWGSALIAEARAAQAALILAAPDVHEGQTVELVLTLTDAQTRGVPQVPAPEGLLVQFQSQSQAIQIVNFQKTIQVSFVYTMTAAKQGEYVIPPVEVMTDKGPLSTSPLKIVVSPRSAAGATEKLVATMPEAVWLGQTVLYHLRFDTTRRMVNGRWNLPDALGFTAEGGVEPMTTEYTVEEDGKPVAVKELDYALRATRPGPQTLSGAFLQAEFPSRRNRKGSDPLGMDLRLFADTTSEMYVADPVKVTVRALPSGAPPDFSGLVGHFVATVKASASEVKVGDTVTLEVRVEGDGSLDGFKLPPLPGGGFRVYDDQPSLSAEVSQGKYTATASFKRAIVPEAPGELTLPGLSLSYFDPVAGRYAVTEAAPIPLKVSGGAAAMAVESFGTVAAPRDVDRLGEDILPNRTGRVPRKRLPTALAWLLLLPGVGLLGVQVLRERRREAPLLPKRQRGFDDLPSDPEARLEAVDRTFREAIAERLGVSPESIRREDLARLGDAAAEADALYRIIDATRYRGDHPALPEDRIRAFVDALR